MSLETVVEDITEEAHARAEEIREEADTRADEIVEAAESDAEAIKEQRQEAVERQIAQEREQALSAAKLEAKQKRLEARRDLLEEVYDGVESHVESIDGEDRRELTAALLEAAATEFDEGDTVSVYGRSDDEALIEELLSEYEDYSYAGEYDCLGGVVLESEASRVRVNNTFDSVLETVWDDNLKAISERLFER